MVLKMIVVVPTIMMMIPMQCNGGGNDVWLPATGGQLPLVLPPLGLDALGVHPLVVIIDELLAVVDSRLLLVPVEAQALKAVVALPLLSVECRWWCPRRMISFRVSPFLSPLQLQASCLHT